MLKGVDLKKFAILAQPHPYDAAHHRNREKES
jgi:hypothetical protein